MVIKPPKRAYSLFDKQAAALKGGKRQNNLKEHNRAEENKRRDEKTSQWYEGGCLLLHLAGS